MLYKNDKPYQLTKSDIDKIKELTGDKYPVKLKYTEGMYTPYPTQEQPNRVDYPASVPILYEEIIVQDGQRIKWNYSDNPAFPHPSGFGMEYYRDCPGSFPLTRVSYLQKKDMEKIFFLLTISSRNADNNGKMPAYRMENAVREAKESINKKKDRVRVENALIGDHQLHVDDVARIAKAFKISGVDEMEEAVVRMELLNAIEVKEKNSKNGYSTFMELADQQDRTEVLSAIQQLKDMKRLIFEGKSNKWFMLDEVGKKEAELCGLARGRSNDESLEYFAMTDSVLRERLLTAAKEKEAVSQD